jgi:Fe-S-cluster-containing dehydrogenase component
MAGKLIDVNRRKFFKIAGVTALGLAGRPALPLLAQEPTWAEPLTAKRWAMLIDIKACLHKEGCRDCINACHRVHNVPDFGNPKDEVKWIWKDHYGEVLPDQKYEYMEDDLEDREVLVFCNHCDNPPCTRVCPTKATWKREDGVVMMDWHRCIGCRYCIAACPYGSRSFNWRDPRPHIREITTEFPTRTRGVVEKCNFCEERLAKGLPPACVEACRDRGLVFGDLEDPNSEVRRILRVRHAIRRKPALGTQPQVYYLV